MPRPTNKQAASKQTLGHSPVYGWGASIDITLDGLTPIISGFVLLDEMRRMWLTDETAGSMRWCITSTMAQVPWAFKAQVDGEDNDEDVDALKYAKFADGLLVDMTDAFRDHVEDAMAMIWGGFAPCEIVLKQRDGKVSRFDDMLWGVSKIPLRDPRTVTNWEYDNDENIVAMRQSTYRGSATIPTWKLCHYRTTSELDNPNGLPLLLPARRAWLLKNRIQDSEAVGIERDLVGLPVFRIPEAVAEQANEVDSAGQPTPAALQARRAIESCKTAVKDMRFNKSGGLVIWSNTYSDEVPTDTTPRWDFKIITTGGQRTIDTRTAARDYDRAIARVMMMQFLHLGDRSTGSYSLSDDQSSMAYKSLMALALKIAEEFTRKVIPLVWDVNGLPKKYMPKLMPGEINKQALQQLGAFMTGLGKVGSLWEADTEMRAAIAKVLGLPFDREIQGASADTAATAADNAAKAPPTGGKPPTTNSGD